MPGRPAQRGPWPFCRQLNNSLSWLLASPFHKLPTRMFCQVLSYGSPFHSNALHYWHRFIGTILDALGWQEAENQHQRPHRFPLRELRKGLRQAEERAVLGVVPPSLLKVIRSPRRRGRGWFA